MPFIFYFSYINDNEFKFKLVVKAGWIGCLNYINSRNAVFSNPLVIHKMIKYSMSPR